MTAGVFAAVVVALSGSAKNDPRPVADWLCRYNMMEKPSLDLFPDGVDPADYIVKSDLEILRAEQKRLTEMAASREVLAEIRRMAATGGRAVIEAVAKRTTCKITPVIVGDEATIEILQTHPVISWGEDMTGLLREIAKLPTKTAQVARAEAAIGKETVVTAFKLRMVREQGAWVAVFGLASTTSPTAAPAAAPLSLALFAVTGAQFHNTTDSLGMQKPIIELWVTNGTAIAISSAGFRGTVISPGRSVPWIKETFSYDIPGGLEPGESAYWTLAPNTFSAWGSVTVPEGAELRVEVIWLKDASGAKLK